jgi:hypothetical protein
MEQAGQNSWQASVRGKVIASVATESHRRTFECLQSSPRAGNHRLAQWRDQRKGRCLHFDELHVPGLPSNSLSVVGQLDPISRCKAARVCHSNLAALDTERRRRDASIVSRPSEPCFARHSATMNFDTVKLISAPRSFEAGGVTDTSSVFSPESTRAASKPLLIRTNPPNNRLVRRQPRCRRKRTRAAVIVRERSAVTIAISRSTPPVFHSSRLIRVA